MAIGCYREGALKLFLGVSTSGKVLRKKNTHFFLEDNLLKSIFVQKIFPQFYN